MKYLKSTNENMIPKDSYLHRNCAIMIRSKQHVKLTRPKQCHTYGGFTGQDKVPDQLLAILSSLHDPNDSSLFGNHRDWSERYRSDYIQISSHQLFNFRQSHKSQSILNDRHENFFCSEKKIHHQKYMDFFFFF